MSQPEPYQAILQTLRPLKQMNYQWRGFLAVCGVVGALAGYNHIRLETRVDDLEKNFDVHVLQTTVDMAKLKSTCEHVSPPRMLRMEIQDAQQDKEIKDIKKRVRMK